MQKVEGDALISCPSVSVARKSSFACKRNALPTDSFSVVIGDPPHIGDPSRQAEEVSCLEHPSILRHLRE